MKQSETVEVSKSVLESLRGVRTFKALSNRNFRWLWASNLPAFLGAQMHIVAQGWLVLELTNSPFYLGLVSAATSLPMLLLAPFGGVLADRMNKRDLLLVIKVLNTAVAATLATLILMGWLNMWHVVAVALMRGALMAFDMPARQSYVGDLVEHSELLNAVSLNTAGMNTMRLLGPAVGGVLLGLVGTAGCFYVLAVAYLFSFGGLLMVDRDSALQHEGSSSAMQDLTGGLRYVFANNLILILLLSEGVIVAFGLPYQTLMPIFADHILLIGASGLGLLLAVNGLGALMGALTIASLGNYQRKGLLKLLSTAAMGVLLIFFAYSSLLPLAVALLLGVGFTFAGRASTMTTLMQTLAPVELRGRVMSAYMMMTWGFQPLGALFLGGLAEATSTPFALAWGGGIVAATSLFILIFVPGVRRLR